MKILAIAHESGFNGGANRSFFTVLSMLKEKYKVDIDVIVPTKSGEFVEAISRIGIRYDVYPYKCDFSVYRDEVKDVAKRLFVRSINVRNRFLAKMVASDYRGSKYDVVYMNTRMSSFGAYLAKEINVPLICHVREFGNPNAIWGCWTLDMVGDYSNRVIAISSAMKNQLVQYIDDDKIFTILNGVDCPILDAPNDDWNSEEVNILLTGRVVEAKGHFDALRAIVELRNRGINYIKLYIAGSIAENTNGIKYKETLEQYIKDNGISKNVIFLGEVSDMLSLRKQMAIELVCSICEPFGRVTVEAMRCGLLVIGANTGGTLDIVIDNETGLLYEQGNEISLADRIEWVIMHPVERKIVQKKGFEYSKSHFTKEENVNQIYKTMRTIVDC